MQLDFVASTGTQILGVLLVNPIDDLSEGKLDAHNDLCGLQSESLLERVMTMNCECLVICKFCQQNEWQYAQDPMTIARTLNWRRHFAICGNLAEAPSMPLEVHLHV